MTLINFGHPFTPAQLDAIADLSGQDIERIAAASTQFNPAEPFTPQARAMVDSAGLTPEEWQTIPLLINLPTLHIIAALVLAEFTGGWATSRRCCACARSKRACRSASRWRRS